MKISSKYCPSQKIRARELTFWENVHPPPVWHVTCNMSNNLIHDIFLKQIWLASQWRVCYKLGLPRLVIKTSKRFGHDRIWTCPPMNRIRTWFSPPRRQGTSIKPTWCSTTKLHGLRDNFTQSCSKLKTSCKISCNTLYILYILLNGYRLGG